MTVQYHKLLDRILIRRAAERESLERQLGENRATPKIMLGLLCVLLAGVFGFFFLPLGLIIGFGAAVAFVDAFRTWRQASGADEALDEELRDEEYRRFLLAKLGPQKFDQLATAVSTGGSEQSIHGWLRPLGFDEHDIEYLLWLAENIVAQVKDGIVEVGGYNVRKPAAVRPVAPAEAEEAVYVSKPPVEAVQTVPSQAPTSEPAPSPDVTGESGPATSNLSPEELEKFRQLGAQRKLEYEKWLASGGGREGSPDDPLGKMGRFTPAQIEELKKKAQERRKKGEAPKSDAPAPAALDHPAKFSEQELKELERKALQRFEPRPKVEGETGTKEEILGEVFSEQDIRALAAKAERKEREKQGRSLPAASDHDPEFDVKES